MPKDHAIVVGSGPNGLAAAITLAGSGCVVRVLEANATIGGGARSAELTLPGFVHDVGVTPSARPQFAVFPDAAAGTLRLGMDPTASCAGPSARRRQRGLSLSGFGENRRLVRRRLPSLVRANAAICPQLENLAGEFLQPVLHLPRHPIAFFKFGNARLHSGPNGGEGSFQKEPARALFAGLAAHSFLPLDAYGSGAFGFVLGAAGHAVGWPLPRGGAQSIANALAACLRGLGGEIITNCRIENLGDSTGARGVVRQPAGNLPSGIAGDQLPARYRKRLESFRHAPSVFKIDYALSAPVPWRAAACRSAGTLHLGGTLDEIAAERAIADGRHPERPFVLAAQQSLFDSTRVPEGRQTLWAYCHVPHGSGRDMTKAVEHQIERFAPGFRDCVLARRTLDAAGLERANPNLIGGDINGGAANLWQLIARPVVSPTPYRTPLPGFHLCSSSTPPGGGVHGMCGYHAARAALRDRFGIRIPSAPA